MFKELSCGSLICAQAEGRAEGDDPNLGFKRFIFASFEASSNTVCIHFMRITPAFKFLIDLVDSFPSDASLQDKATRLNTCINDLATPAFYADSTEIACVKVDSNVLENMTRVGFDY